MRIAFGRTVRTGLLLSGLLVAPVVMQLAHAQGGGGSTQILVPFAPGGPVDFVARTLATKMAARTGSPVVADNRPGANGLVSANALLPAAPDGKTLMVTGQGLMTISAHLTKLPFDPLTDLTPISGLAYADSALVVGKHVQANTLKEFIELAKKSQPLLAMGSGGKGNITHLYMERLKDVAGVDFLHVPYKGVGPAMQDVMGGQIAGVVTGLVAAIPQIKSGQAKALGLVGDTRSALFPDVPTMAEQGYPVLDVGWFGLIAPPRMRPETVRSLAATAGEIFREEDTKAALAKVGLNVWPKSADELSRIMREESARWAKLIRDKNITE